MSKLNQAWALALAWASKRIRSPFSNFATKFVLFLGSGIVATPLLEHLIFNAVLNHFFGIDLGIEVPDTQAYIAGVVLIALSLTHNLLFNKLDHSYQVNIKNVETSIYKSLWDKLDAVLDDTARLSNLYSTYYSAQDDDLALKTEESIISCADHLRKNRPFYFSDDFYEKCISICNDSYVEARAFRACIQAKKEEELAIGKDASLSEKIEYYEKHYNYDKARKEAKKNLTVIKSQSEKVCADIRSHIGCI
ncbi:hypothetical protein DND62_24270 [Pseudomonas syringae pv. pisi]|nr:hypothetical protein DND62_24270 [Pseudomonas syringae pv. pisi]